MSLSKTPLHKSFQVSSHHPLKKLLFILPVVVVLIFFSLRLKKEIPVSIQSIPPSKDSKMISRIMQIVEENYVDATLVDPIEILKKSSKNLERAIPPLLVKETEKSFDLSLGDKKLTIPVDRASHISDMAMPIAHILGFINQYYSGKPTEEDRTTIALTGATETLDPHTNYMPKKYYNEFKIGTKGNFGGLGIVIGVRQGVLTVISPLEDTPAFKAGIKAKDQIVQINEESTINMNISEAVDRLRGPVGTKVSIVVKREGEDNPLNLTLVRAMIHIQSVAGKLLENHYGLIRLKNFQQDTFDDFNKMYKSFLKSEAKDGLQGLVLDLRGNPGGLLDQAIQISDFFLQDGVIVKTVDGHGETLETESSKPGDAGESIPLVVIIDEGSASASEIVSGALKYNNRAIIIGNRSFGKGSVQTVYDLKDGSGLKLTIAHYLTAHDQKVQSIGINPHIGLLPIVVDAKKN
ncbi:MAG: PDZ domain-containing protein [Deltaproteobacteria bacterium]|nr:MAG: PDZ domain-containing protein [Deltaproteobacteria bacterium]